ncbi:hypothetical protein [Mycobacteroides abscessus]|uniref:hypothetical protein n=1 Tax=Mycobacteroides abscessus TaxID=36809 RepID=UPI000E682F76|nr:hypothetical protein [Mycobacteroides abscessus]RIS81295.1 hypothetical protein D2E44_14650 [Mycobacteroides abscessus]
MQSIWATVGPLLGVVLGSLGTYLTGIVTYRREKRTQAERAAADLLRSIAIRFVQAVPEVQNANLGIAEISGIAPDLLGPDGKVNTESVQKVFFPDGQPTTQWLAVKALGAIDKVRELQPIRAIVEELRLAAPDDVVTQADKVVQALSLQVLVAGILPILGSKASEPVNNELRAFSQLVRAHVGLPPLPQQTQPDKSQTAAASTGTGS